MKKLSLILFFCLATVPFLQAERLVLVSASYGKNILAITDADGKVLWSHKTAGPQRGHTGHHDVHMLPNGNILFHDTWTTLKEITLDKKVVWENASAAPLHEKQIATAKVNAQRAATIKAQEKIKEGN